MSAVDLASRFIGRGIGEPSRFRSDWSAIGRRTAQMVWAALNKHTIAAVNELSASQSHRVVAVLGASLADEFVLRTLELRLRKKNKIQKGRKKNKIQKRMIDPRRVLRGFVNRIDLAYLLYAIDEPLHVALEGIAQIRNVFAHQLAISSFDDPDEQLAEGFEMLKLHQGRAHYPSSFWIGDTTEPLGPVSTRREVFIVNLRIALLLLQRDMGSHLPYTNAGRPIPGPQKNRPGGGGWRRDRQTLLPRRDCRRRRGGAAMDDLLTLRGRCGLQLFDDYRVYAGGGGVISEHGQRKVEALAATDPALPQLIFDASARELAKVLRLGGVSQRWRRRTERMLREGW
jgi:hypothetical protein